VEARGVSSLAELAPNDGGAIADGEVFIGTQTPAASSPIAGPMNDLVLAKISAVANAFQQATSVAVPSGKQTFAGFQVSASPHTNSFHGSNDVRISSMAVTVTAQNVQADPNSYRLYNPENPAAGVACTAGQSTGTFTVNCPFVAGMIQDRIGQGQQAKYLLEAVITDTELVPGESTLVGELAPLGQRNQTNAIVWSDEVTSMQWVDVPELRVQSTLYRAP
jgi:hypothetical protein